MKADVLIIGAGLSGLAAGEALQRLGWRVTVLEQAAGPGGRLAASAADARFDTGAAFDAGAQFFTVRDPRFRALAERWLREGAARHWFDGYPSPAAENPQDRYPRFRGHPDMGAPAAALARDIAVQYGRQVTALSRRRGRWQARTVREEEYSAAWLLLTPPAPLALRLLEAGNSLPPPPFTDTLRSIRYEPCLTLLVQLEGAAMLPAPGALYLPGPVLSWMADNFEKGISAVPGALTLHAAGAWSREQWTAPDAALAAAMLEPAAPYLGSPVRHWRLRRWPYARPQTPLAAGALPVPGMNLVFAGDAFEAARIEGAVLSGLRAADLLAAALS